MSLETERKFLIEMPDEDFLVSVSKDIWHITQTYLASSPCAERRVRRIETDSGVTYVYTEKTDVSGFIRQENEREISEIEYNLFLREKEKELSKTRYRIPYDGKTVEIDIYPNMTDSAICEVELKSPSDTVNLPDYLTVIREVTGDSRYKNSSLAK